MKRRANAAEEGRAAMIQAALRKTLEGFMGREKWQLLAIDVRVLISGGPKIGEVRHALPTRVTMAMDTEDMQAVLAFDFDEEMSGSVKHSELPRSN